VDDLDAIHGASVSRAVGDHVVSNQRASELRRHLAVRRLPVHHATDRKRVGPVEAVHLKSFRNAATRSKAARRHLHARLAHDMRSTALQDNRMTSFLGM